MVNYRIFLAGFIALAVAAAPLSAVLIVAPAATAAGTHDCQGEIPQDADSTNCPDCDAKRPANCPGDGGKCCKLTGTIAALPVLVLAAATTEGGVEPRAPLGWQLKPQPPPPRT